RRLQTGDASMMVLYMLIALMSLMALAVWCIAYTKRSR
ncbi:MAG: sortase B protein-sorting domain-containing protein, partial [Lachnospiraceae bacterium]|nr:sortase B protein-sorting domain-containing protein [Lachnospiraceae bacterium]